MKPLKESVQESFAETSINEGLFGNFFKRKSKQAKKSKHSRESDSPYLDDTDDGNPLEIQVLILGDEIDINKHNKCETLVYIGDKKHKSTVESEEFKNKYSEILTDILHKKYRGLKVIQDEIHHGIIIKGKPELLNNFISEFSSYLTENKFKYDEKWNSYNKDIRRDIELFFKILTKFKR